MNTPSLTWFVANIRRAGIYIVIYGAMGAPPAHMANYTHSSSMNMH
jgi:hypothetical protein